MVIIFKVKKNRFSQVLSFGQDSIYKSSQLSATRWYCVLYYQIVTQKNVLCYLQLGILAICWNVGAMLSFFQHRRLLVAAEPQKLWRQDDIVYIVCGTEEFFYVNSTREIVLAFESKLNRRENVLSNQSLRFLECSYEVSPFSSGDTCP